MIKKGGKGRKETDWRKDDETRGQIEQTVRHLPKRSHPQVVTRRRLVLLFKKRTPPQKKREKKRFARDSRAGNTTRVSFGTYTLQGVYNSHGIVILCVRACVCACACARAFVCMEGRGGGGYFIWKRVFQILQALLSFWVSPCGSGWVYSGNEWPTAGEGDQIEQL